ncbi:MAG: alpha-hydroxy-acid oxidizing protein [Sphingomonadales bacterium]|nr:alpha-hydroxy-acid oxidizing protein [Sphingomonadales bacterium]
MGIRFTWCDEAPPASIAQWRALARRKLPDLAYAYIESGADDLITLGANEAAFARWRLRQRVLTGVAKPDLSATLAGETLALPVALAPTGTPGLTHWQADLAAARAAEAKGSRFVLSTASSYSLEEVAGATGQARWFQLYPFADRDKVGGLIDRAAAAGYTALFVTVDVPVVGNREGERAAGLTRPWSMTPPRLWSMLRRPAWLWGTLRHRRVAAIHYLERHAPPPPGLSRAIRGAGDDAAQSAETQARYMQADLHWDDLAWMRERWRGRLYVKGVLDADDAARAVDVIGADGVVVSNHGGRQLDRAVATLDALPAIAARVGDRAEVWLDGGVRRGTDVITALCLGADGVLIGRPWLYGLGAAGQAGVEGVLECFRAEIERGLVLMGCPSLAALDRSWLIPQADPA